MPQEMTIIGLSGPNGSGKDAVGLLLAAKHQFLFISVSDLLRDELRKRGLSAERQNMRALSTEWRRKFGLSVLVDQAIKTFEASNAKGQYQGLVVASLRNPYEADRIHDLGGTVVWVDADPRVRFERLQIAKRKGREGDDDKTFEQFTSEEQIEMQSSGDEAMLNMSAVKEKSDKLILNDTANMEVLEQSVEDALGLN